MYEILQPSSTHLLYHEPIPLKYKRRAPSNPTAGRRHPLQIPHPSFTTLQWCLSGAVDLVQTLPALALLRRTIQRRQFNAGERCDEDCRDLGHLVTILLSRRPHIAYSSVYVVLVGWH